MIKGSIRHMFFAGIFLSISFAVLGANAPITTIATVTNAVSGQQVNVPITVTGFNNIGMMYLTLDYEYAKLHFVSGTPNSALTGNLSIGDTDMGNGFHRLIISWFTGSGVTLPDGSTVVNYVFTYISGSAPLTFFEMGPSCEYTDADAVVLNDIPYSTYYNNGLVTSSISVNARAFLEGPYSSGTMSTTLNSLGVIQLLQPYNGSPWFYNGTEQVASIPANVTDWILVELRTTTAASSRVATRAGFITNTGYITDLSGTGFLNFSGVSPGNYYIVIRHRNHLPVMSAAAVAFSSSGVLYDFSLGSGQAYGGTNGCKNISSGVWGMISADASSEGSIFLNDYTDFWVPSFGTTNGYFRSDFNMDGQIFLNDYTDYWVPNFGKSNVLP